ncbi:hypothetical protein ACROYT_G033078 [Oculina patagonica]
MLCLQQIEGITYNPTLQPEKILLKPTVTRFGRSGQHSDVVVDSSISPLMISRVHAEIHFENGKYRIDCKGLNGLLVNKAKRSSAVLCDGDEIVFGGAGVKAKEGETSPAHDSELVYVFKDVCQNDSEEAGSLGEGTSDGRVRRRSKRKQPVSTSDELSGPPEKKNKVEVKSKKVPEDHDDKKVEIPSQEKEGSKQEERSKKCLADLNEELLCCICRELMVLAHTLPCSHTFCFGCIRDWLAHSNDCPNCRAKAQLKSAVPVKVLDNTINKVAEEVLSPEELEERQQKIQEMQEEAKKKTPKVIAVSSTSSDSSDSELDESTDSELTSDEEFPHENYRFGVEHARSGRARCRTCYASISLADLRWMVQFNTSWERYYEQTHYHHLGCFLPPAYVTFDELSVASDISRAEQRIIKARLRAR